MGIDVHGLNFLRYAKQQHREFKKSITIGRQGFHVTETIVRGAVWESSDPNNDLYCEELLKNHFGANIVDSIDNSKYENASIIHDMNLPIPSEFLHIYDTVIDGGCLEHIYNIPQALKNCSLFCKPGGQILHMLPANNQCGHGFWQFSPELFFSLYSNQNGYQDTEVFLADLTKTTKWFKVRPPTNGQRVNIISSTELYVLVRTVLREINFSHSNVQQSDYVHEWTKITEKNATGNSKPKNIKQYIKQSPLLHILLSPAYHYWRTNLSSKSKLNKFNPDLTEIKIKSILQPNQLHRSLNN